MAKSQVSILLFEDDEGQALLTKETLERDGFLVDVCRTGREGLHRLVGKEYGACLIDMTLPDLPGFEVLRRINMVRPGSVCVIITSHGDEVAAIEAKKVGADDYIVKSPYMGHLVALPLVVREGLERRQLRRQREELQAELWEHARLLAERNAELRRANEELKRLNRLKSDMVSAASQELRSPLSTVREFAGILADELAGPTTTNQQEYLEIIRGNVGRLARIIDDLLDIAKLETGRMALDKRIVEVRSLIEGVMGSLRPEADGKQLQVDVRLPKQCLNVLADGDKVRQVLTHLVANAIQLTPGPGRVTVEVEEQDQVVQFCVTDTGAGMDPKDLDGLFEDLPAPPAGGGTNGAGMGDSLSGSVPGSSRLGLVISKRFVELHGGRMWAESQSGSGSAFFFTLPKRHEEDILAEYLRTGVTQAKQRQSHCSVIMLAIAEFQALKARHGDERLDRLLKEAEHRLERSIRRKAGDIMVRSQSGQMVVVLAEMDLAGCRASGERIQQALEDRPFRLGQTDQWIHVVTGSATFPEEALDEKELLRVAEERLRSPGSSNG